MNSDAVGMDVDASVDRVRVVWVMSVEGHVKREEKNKVTFKYKRACYSVMCMVG